MAKVRRFSGRLKMELSFNDRTDQYRVRLCPMVKREPCETVYVKPRSSKLAVDSALAYDSAARAAISFSKNAADFAEPNGAGWEITRPRRKR